MSAAASTHDVLGTTITMPVQIRDARCFVAGFSADAAAVRRAIAAASGPGITAASGRGITAASGPGVPASEPAVRPLLIRPGRTMCMLVFVEYVDGDLGPYHEFGVCFLVEDPATPPASPWAALRSLAGGDARALVHRLPVDGEFTLAAGRGIWGFPKTMAEFSVDHDSPRRSGRVVADGRLIVDLGIRRGVPVPDSTADTVLHAYSQLDGVLRRTPWRLTSTTGTRTRIGGASLRLGTHEIADELRTLRLGRHALMTSSVEHITMTFEDPSVVSEARD